MKEWIAPSSLQFEWIIEAIACLLSWQKYQFVLCRGFLIDIGTAPGNKLTLKCGFQGNCGDIGRKGWQENKQTSGKGSTPQVVGILNHDRDRRHLWAESYSRHMSLVHCHQVYEHAFTADMIPLILHTRELFLFAFHYESIRLWITTNDCGKTSTEPYRAAIFVSHWTPALIKKSNSGLGGRRVPRVLSTQHNTTNTSLAS